LPETYAIFGRNKNNKVGSMTTKSSLSRRRFLQSTSTITGASLLRIGAPALIAITESACTAKQEGAAFVTIGSSAAAELAAIAARIIPTTDTPGATEAGVIHFIDQALGAEMNSSLESMLSDLSEFNVALAEAHPGAEGLASLAEAEQDAFLKTVENGDLFGLVRTMTIIGMFAMSKYGGNKDNIGWQLLNFEGAHGGWQYPFGHYDAAVHGGADHGE
jgi:gluconate 2-dehydrogenase gamma chain